MAYSSLWLEDPIAVFYCHDCGKIFAKTQLLFYLQDLCMTKRKEILSIYAYREGD